MYFQKLSEGHLHLVDAFHCVEPDALLAGYNAKERRRIKLHSKEMEDFLKAEAFDEQECNMNTTYLLLNKAGSKILAYVSLCNDSIGLEISERETENVHYGSAPALKIARLAVEAAEMRRGIGTFLLDFAAFQAQQIREHAGVFFLTLDCYAHRVSYYERHGFVKNLLQPIVLPYDSPISMRVSIDSYLENFAERYRNN